MAGRRVGEDVAAVPHGRDAKPFGVGELNARLRVALRRAAGPGADRTGLIEVGSLVLDVHRHEVRVDGRRVELTVAAAEEAAAPVVAERLASELLANPLIEAHTIERLQAPSSTTSTETAGP